MLVSRPRQPGTKKLADCLNTDAVGDIIGISGAEIGGRPQVTKVVISVLADMPGVGIIISKPSATTAVVQFSGEVRGIYTGMVPGQVQLVSAAARPTPTTPTPSFGVPRIYLQSIGIATDPGVLLLTPNFQMTIRHYA